MMFPTEHRYDMYGPKDKLGDGGSYHNVPSVLSDLIDKHHVHQQNTVFDQGNSQQGRCGKFHHRPFDLPRLIEIQIVDHNYEQKNGIHSDQQSVLEVSYTHTDPLTKAETTTG
jgi:hypothetical protein